MIEVKKIDNFNAISSLSRQWNDLLNNSDSASIFQTFEWYKSFIKHFNRNRLLILLAFEYDELIGIAPLQFIELHYLHLFRITKIVFIGERFSEYCDFILKKNKENEILTSFFDSLKTLKFDWIDLTDIDARSQTPNLLQNILKNRNNSEFIPKIKEYKIYHSIDTSSSAEIYYKQFTPKTLNTIERKFQKIRADFDFKIVFNNNGDPDAFKRLQDFNIKRMQKKNSVSFFSDKKNTAFLNDIIEDLSKKGHILFSNLFLNNSLSSVYLCFVYKENLYYFLSGYDASYENYSIGKIHLKSVIEFSFQNKFHKFDFLRGDDAYKAGWHTDSVYSKRAIIIKNSISIKLFRNIFEFISLFLHKFSFIK